MAHAAPAQHASAGTPWSQRVRTWLPWLGLLAWAAGCVGLWYLSQRYQWGLGELVLAGCGWLVVLMVAARDSIRGMFGPVFTYEITRLGRRRLTFILRLLYILGVMGLLALMYLAWLEEIGYFRGQGLDRVPSERLSNFATEFFYAFIGVQYGVVVLLTPAYVAGTVADEKERKTLEFLLATDLRNREIIFGKVAARVTNLLMFVLAGLPVIAFMQLFGGIDPDQLLAATAATVLTVIGLSAVSVAFSVAMRRPRDAIALTYMAMVVYFVGSFVLAMYLLYLQVTLARGGAIPYEVLGVQIDPAEVVNVFKVVTDWIGAGNVLYVLAAATAPGGGFSQAAVATALFRYAVFWGAATALALGYAVARLRAVALYQAYGVPRQVRGGIVARAAARSRPVVGEDPMFWKEVFVEGGVKGGCLGWIISSAIVILVFLVPCVIVYNIFIDPPTWVWGGRWTAAQQWDEFTEAMNVWVRVATGILGFLGMMAAAVRGAAVVSGERDRDTWVSLMSTPLTAWEMLRAKWLGCLLGLRRLYFTLFLAWALALTVGAVDPPMIILTALYLAVFISAFAWIGIFCSITARTTLIATVRALMISLFVVGGFWIFLGLCCALPLSIAFDGPDLDVIEYGLNLLLGCTPPFVIGWMPLMNYERSDMGPFHWEETRSLGPLNPIFGFGVWFAVNWILGILSWQAFRKATNRVRDVLAGQLPRRPRPPAQPMPTRKPLPVARRVENPPRDPGDEPLLLD